MKRDLKQKSKIGKYGYRWVPVEGYVEKNGKEIPPHMKKARFQWKES